MGCPGRAVFLAGAALAVLAGASDGAGCAGHATACADGGQEVEEDEDQALLQMPSQLPRLAPGPPPSQTAEASPEPRRSPRTRQKVVEALDSLTGEDWALGRLTAFVAVLGLALGVGGYGAFVYWRREWTCPHGKRAFNRDDEAMTPRRRVSEEATKKSATTTKALLLPPPQPEPLEPVDCKPLAPIEPSVPALAGPAGTTFVLPWTKVGTSSLCTVHVDISVCPAVWPLRAVLGRPEETAAWARLDLTVEIIDAAGLPPLLTCRRVVAPVQEGTGGTGDTGRDAGAAPEGAFLEVRTGNGALAAWIVRRAGGPHLILRPDLESWEVSAGGKGGGSWLAVQEGWGKTVALAADLPDQKAANVDDEEQLLRVAAQPDTSSPESVLLLMCMLSLLAFDP